MKYYLSDETHLQVLTIAQFKELFKQMIKENFPAETEKLSYETESKTFVTIKEVQERLHVTKPTIYNWRNKGLIKPMKIGGRVLYNLEEILEKLRKTPAVFSNGRDYLHTNPDRINTFTIAERKYQQLKYKYKDKKENDIPEKDQDFMNEFQSKYLDVYGNLRKEFRA